MLDQSRRLAQKAFASLLDRFEPVAQFLLVSRLFQLLFQREIVLSKDVYEPQLLAFLVDVFRQKCFPAKKGADISNVEDDDQYKCSRHMFRNQLSHFYGQIDEVVYEDPFVAIHFYTAVLLLVRAHAANRARLPLLRTSGRPLVDKFRSQLRDLVELRERQRREEAAENANYSSQVASTVKMIMSCERSLGKEEDRARLSLLSFQLDQTEQRVREALLSCQ